MKGLFIINPSSGRQNFIDKIKEIAGMLAQQTNVEIISNNIANMNTTAYSRRRAEFHDLLYQNMPPFPFPKPAVPHRKQASRSLH